MVKSMSASVCALETNPASKAELGGFGQAAAARVSRLASLCLAQRGVELCDGEVDVRIRVRARDEPRLEGRARRLRAGGRGEGEQASEPVPRPARRRVVRW